MNSQREAFENGHIETDAISWNGTEYSPSNEGKYAAAVAETANNLYGEFKRGWQAAKEQGISVPNEHGKNRYGLDMSYFRNLINRELNRPLVDFMPSELARVLARASRTADSSVLFEPEFQSRDTTRQAAMAQGGEAVAHMYKFADPISGRPVWRFDPGPWNAQRPTESKPLYTHPPKPTGGGVPAFPEDFIQSVRRLAFSARTSGGTAGRDGDLCRQVERVEAMLEAMSDPYWPRAGFEPDGWILVPKDPTDFMLDSTYSEVSIGGSEDYRQIWSAMIDARPDDYEEQQPDHARLVKITRDLSASLLCLAEGGYINDRDLVLIEGEEHTVDSLLSRANALLATQQPPEQEAPE